MPSLVPSSEWKLLFIGGWGGQKAPTPAQLELKITRTKQTSVYRQDG